MRNIVGKEYGNWIMSKEWDIIGTLGFYDTMSSKGGRSRLNRLWSKINDDKHGYRLSGIWVKESSYSNVLHYHFIGKLEGVIGNGLKSGMINDVKNRIFKYWLYNGSSKIDSYNKSRGNWGGYIFKDCYKNDYEYDLIT